MSSCRYCTFYVLSVRRLQTDEEGNKSKNAPTKRLCEATKTWQTFRGEMCEKYDPSYSFWCDKLEQNMNVDACRNKRANKMSRHCKTCRQYNDILDVIRFRARIKKTEVANQSNEMEVVSKPTLLRRK